PWFGMRLHNTMRPDRDRHLHDHPWWNVSLILKGGYVEKLPVSQKSARWHMHTSDGVMVEDARFARRDVGAIVVRRATDRHSLVALSCVPCWSLFIVGRKRRGWGFHTPQGWVPEAIYRQQKGTM
ncbi:MAG: hypothetical protein ACREVR_10275, partial [Burkholderiales bacterium]